jgi:hypothetical protein
MISKVLAVPSTITVSTSMCGRLRVGKNFLHYAAALVGAAMCSAFKRGSHDRWP